MTEEQQGWTMQEPNREPKRRYRLPPCPSYDVDGMEQWLCEMAQGGWLLEKDGFFADVASFVQSAPCHARYRLEAATKSTSMWTEDGGDPPPEAVALSEEYEWEYVGKRGCFYIYRTLKPGTRELNTDPTVQALAVAAAQKRQVSSLVSSLFLPIFYLVLCLSRGGLLLTMITASTFYFLFMAGLVLLAFGTSLAEVVAMGRLKRRLREGLPAPPTRRRPALYFAQKALVLVLLVVWACVSLRLWVVSVTDEDHMPLEQYGQHPPFATLTDLAGEGAHGYRQTMTGARFNYISVHSDPLAPENIQWAEHASVKRADGSTLDGGLYVYYHRAASPWIAGRLARAYLRSAQSKKSYEAIELPELDADFAAAYYDDLHWPNIVIQKGDVACRVQLYETGIGPHMTLEEWAGAFVQSLAEAEKGE